MKDIHKYPGTFFVIEGMDGAGKGSVLENLKLKLEEIGVPYITTFEPGGTPLGNAFRRMAKHPEPECEMSNEVMLLTMLAARVANLQQNIIPALKEGKVVLCDRFTLSTLVYQGKTPVLFQMIKDITAMLDIPKCYTLFLDVSYEASMSRRDQRGKEDFIETSNSGKIRFTDMQNTYTSLLEEYSSDYYALDTTNIGIDEASDHAFEFLSETLESRKSPKTK